VEDADWQMRPKLNMRSGIPYIRKVLKRPEPKTYGRKFHHITPKPQGFSFKLVCIHAEHPLKLLHPAIFLFVCMHKTMRKMSTFLC
jgi:hypothetical protein